MKILTCMFCLSVAVCSAQDYSRSVVGDTVYEKEFWHTNTLPKTSRHTLTLEDYEQYEKECYKDSSLISKHEKGIKRIGGMFVITDSESCSFNYYDTKCLTSSHYKKLWVHKNPSFRGFIDFIKKKRDGK